ncbi:zinc ABC transporter substrate-binding protein [Endozoicomonas sp. (ex Bugula neritina AB1)]|nr:zinc ABC transporter substrate-binding protein [Endozoicomonas sp. (ex Bugula neritina AB1)]
MRINSNLLTIPSLLVLLSPPVAQANLSVFACEPEWGALVHQLAPKASVFNATTAKQDPHQVQARPSLISKLSKADIAVCSGASLEIGWLPALQMKAANPKVQNNKPGMFFAAKQVETIDKHDHIDPTMGDVHPEGNPHLQFDPYRLQEIAQKLSVRLSIIDPTHGEQYKTNYDHFASDWEKNIQHWEKEAQPLKGMQVIAYHSSFNYLFNWLGIKMVGDLEPKAGLPPSSKHLASLLDLTRKTKIDAIVYTSYQDERGAKWLGEKTNIPIVRLPFSVDTSENNTLKSLYASLISKLLKVKSGS